MFGTGNKAKGPKMVEMFYFADNGKNKNLVVVERRNRRTGELVSQTVMSTAEAAKERILGTGPILLPPKEVKDKLNDVRDSDTRQLVEKTGAIAGTRTIGDLVRTDFDMGSAIDGPGGVYEQQINQIQDPAERALAERNLKRMKNRGIIDRAGGFMYWMRPGDRARRPK
jgi:hypothetical protein